MQRVYIYMQYQTGITLYQIRINFLRRKKKSQKKTPTTKSLFFIYISLKNLVKKKKKKNDRLQVLKLLTIYLYITSPV